MADKESKEVTASPIHTLSEANQTLAENLAAAQKRNLEYAQSVFESTIELLKNHVKSARSLLQEWEQETQKRQGGSRAADTYLGLFRAPLDAYQKVLETMETTSKQTLESFEKATESFEKSLHQWRERWQEAAGQAQHSTRKSEK
jgi:flagellar biosynthesis chaperone FliJ